MEKPLTLVFEELKKDIADLINCSGLPAFMVEPILKEYMNEVHVSAMRQYEYDKEQYEAYLSDYNAASDSKATFDYEEE